MNQYGVKSFRDISGGVAEHLVDRPGEMPDSAWARLANFEYSRTGSLKSRGGYQVYNATPISSATSMDGAMRFYHVASGTNTLVVSINHPTNNKIYAGNDAAGTFSEITSGSALTTATPVYWLVARDTLLISNGVEKIQYFSGGTTKQNVVSSDNYRYGKYLAWADNILWIAGDSSNPNTVWASIDGLYTTSPGTDCSFPNVNFIKIPVEDNDKITGLLTYENELLIFRNKNIYILEGVYQDWSLRRIDGVGAYDQRAVCLAGKYGLFFCGQDGIFWKPTINTEPVPIWTGIQNTWRNNFWTNAVVGWYPRNRYVYIAYSTTSGGNNTKCVVWDAENQRWVGPHDFGMKGFVAFDGVADAQDYYGLSVSEGTVYKLDATNQDNGTSFTCQGWTKHHDLGDVSINKLARLALIGMRPSTESAPVVITAVINRGSKTASTLAITASNFSKWGTFVWGLDSWGNGESYSTAKTPFENGVKGREIQMRFEKTDANAFELFDYGLEYRDETFRRRAD